MNISFQCDVCSRSLSANAVAAGRVITCPFCRNTTKIPEIEEEEKPQGVVEQNIEGESSTASNVSRWRDPTFDPDWEKMLEKFPNFKPNPFGISFPLDKAILEANSNEEYNDEDEDSDASNGSAVSQYSVDDLIKGIE